MKYSKIEKFFKANGIWMLDADIVSCVSAASYHLDDEEFDLICSYVKRCWNKTNKSYTQLLADIVCDLYENCEYGYRDANNNIFLTKEDLKDKTKIEMVIDIFNEKYYDL